MGHVWPGMKWPAEAESRMGPSYENLSASREMIELFKAHPLPDDPQGKSKP